MNHRISEALIAGAYWFIRISVGFFIKTIWVKRVTGLEHIPQNGAAILALNHQSYFDFLCLAAVCPRNIHFLSAEKFFTNPLWAIVMKITGQLRVPRKNRDKRELYEFVKEHLVEGKLIGIFPEGTRSPHPDEMLQAYPGVAKFALFGGVDVIPVGISGAYEVMSRHDARPKLRKIIELHVGKPIDLSPYRNTKMNDKGFQVIAHKIMTEIAKLSGKKYSHHGKFRE